MPANKILLWVGANLRSRLPRQLLIRTKDSLLRPVTTQFLHPFPPNAKFKSLPAPKLLKKKPPSIMRSKLVNGAWKWPAILSLMVMFILMAILPGLQIHILMVMPMRSPLLPLQIRKFPAPPTRVPHHNKCLLSRLIFGKMPPAKMTIKLTAIILLLAPAILDLAKLLVI